MKRILSLALALILVLAIPVVSFADIDLSGMSFDELVALKDQINLAIWQSEDWQQVEVPQGVYQIGVDIPAGKWTITPKADATTYIKVGDETTNGGTEVKMKFGEVVWDTGAMMYKEGNLTEYTIELEDGQYLQVDNGIAVFSPYSGKPTLGFK